MTHLLIKRLAFCLISASILAVSVAAQEQRSPVKGAPRSEMSTKRLHPKKAPQQLRSQPAPVHKPSNSTVVYSAGDIVIYGTYTKGYKGGFCHFGSTDAKTSWTSDYESYSSVFNTGTWIDGKYYATAFDEDYDDVPFFSIWDTESYRQISSKSTTKSDCANDLTYDPSTDQIFGIFYNISSQKFEFGTLNKNTGRQEKIADIPVSVCMRPLGIASTENGDIYVIGFGSNNNDYDSYYSTYLFKADPQSGAFTVVGPTGIDCSTFLQSACFDFKSGKLFWAGLQRDSGVIGGVARLFEVNVATGAATAVCDLPDDMDITGIYSRTTSQSDDAPGKVTNITFTAGASAKSGELSFNLPSDNIAGTSLSGTIAYTVTYDGKSASGSGTPGSRVKVNVSVATSGEYTFTIVCSNNSGNGKASSLSTYVGYAVPAAPASVTASLGTDGTVIVEITPPVKGVGAGVFNPDELVYTVVRYPDEAVIAQNTASLSVNDRLPAGQSLTAYKYGAKASNDGLTGDEKQSQKIVFGNSLDLPFTESFDTPESVDFFTFIDANGDGYGWAYYDSKNSTGPKNKSIICSENPRDSKIDKDDYAVTPPLNLKANVNYTLQYDYLSRGTADNNFPESMAVYLGQQPTVDGLTRTLVPEETEIRTNTEWITHPEVEFTVPSDGTYYIAFHNNSKGSAKYELGIDNISIKGRAISSPAPMTFTATPDAGGESRVVLTGKYPATTFDGEPISSLLSLTLSRNGRVIHTVENPLPGADFSYTDNEAAAGVNEYSIVVTNNGGDSEPFTVSTFTGFDCPEAIAGLSSVETSAGVVSLAWTAPEKGEHNGVIKTDELKYTVVRVDEQGTAVSTVAENITATSYTDIPTLDGQQELVIYQVTASTEAGESVPALTEKLQVGQPYATPFVESFANGKITTKPWLITEQDGVTWMANQNFTEQQLLAADGDNGLLQFHPSGRVDRQADMTSPKISVKNGENPYFSIYCCYNYSSNDIEFQISRNGGEFQTFHTHSFDNLEAPGVFSWHEFKFPLSEYIDDEYIQIRLHGEAHHAYMAGTFFDKFSVIDRRTYDLQCTALEGPAALAPNEEGTFIATVKNVGMKSVEEWTVELCRADGTVAATVPGTRTLNSNSSASVELKTSFSVFDNEDVLLFARVSSPLDKNEGNNASQPTKVLVSTLPYPTVNDLAIGSISADKRNVTLEWSAPDFSAYTPQPIVDGAEAYTDFAISNIGQWRCLDIDNLPSYPFANPTTMAPCEYPYNLARKAWQVFNPFKVEGLVHPDATFDETHSLYPHGGSKYLIAFAAYSDDKSVPAKNDDWLISPPLSGQAQNISFYARSSHTAYDEKFEVYYSTAEPVRDDMRMLKSLSANFGWKQHAFSLPEGARYFAIRYVGEDAMALLLDDIVYIPKSSTLDGIDILGYNVYRDGELLTPYYITEPTFTDTDVTGEHTWHVTVVYSKGESNLSNGVTASPLPIDEITADFDTPQNLYTVNGIYLGQVTTAAELRSLPAGIYIVGNRKVIVK